MAFFDDPANASGALASNLSSYPNNILETMGFNVMLIFVNIVNVLSSSILAIATGWKLGLVVVFGGMCAPSRRSRVPDGMLQLCPHLCPPATCVSDSSSNSKKRPASGLPVARRWPLRQYLLFVLFPVWLWKSTSSTSMRNV